MDRLDAIGLPPEECVMRDSQDTQVVYDIPLEALPSYRDRRVLLRSTSPAPAVLARRPGAPPPPGCGPPAGFAGRNPTPPGGGCGVARQLPTPPPPAPIPPHL